MRLKYEPSSEPIHISAKQLFKPQTAAQVHVSTAFYPMELFYGQIYDGNLYADLREK